MFSTKIAAWLLAGVVGGAVIGGPLAVAGADKLQERHFKNSPLGRLIMGNFGRVLVLRSELNVTPEQKEKIHQILKSHKAEAAPIAKSLTEKGRALRKAVLADNSDEAAIRKAADELGKAIGDAAVLASKVGGEVKPVLTQEQRERIGKFLREQDEAKDKFLSGANL